MTEIGVGFGVFLTGAGVFSALSPRRWETLPCVAMFLAGWAVAVTVDPHVERPEDLLIFAAMDVICGFMVMRMFESRPATWKLAVAFCFLTQALIHAIFMIVSFAWGFTPERLYRYQLAVNIVLVIATFCASWPGIANVVRVILSWVLSVFGVRRGVGAGDTG